MRNLIRLFALSFCIWLVACGRANDDSSLTASQPGSQRALIQSVKPLSQLEKTKTGFYYPTGSKKIDFMNGWWLSKDPDYLSGKYHLGVDMKLGYSEPVYAIGKGTLWFISDSGWDLSDVQNPKNCAAVVKHELHDGSKFTVVYGHLLCETLVFKIGGAEIKAGDVIGYIGDWGNADHLHFGIVPPGESWSDGSTLGMRPVSHWVTNCAKVKDCSNGFTDPVHFIETEWAYDRPQEVQVSCQGGICWKPQGVACESASEWYRLSSTTAPYRGVSMGREVCSELQEKMQYITSAPNPQEWVLEDKWWQRWFRKAWKFLGLGETASAAEAQALSGYVDKITLQVSTGDVTVSWSIDQEGVGRGQERLMSEPPDPDPPDFVTKRVWLQTPWGTEVYKYGLGENFDTKAQAANIGNGPCKSGEISDITGHFYLSKGYKEDVHSGTDAWRRIDSTTTQCDNLKPGDTNTETKNISRKSLD